MALERVSDESFPYCNKVYCKVLTRERFYGPWTEMIYNVSMINYNRKSLEGNMVIIAVQKG